MSHWWVVCIGLLIALISAIFLSALLSIHSYAFLAMYLIAVVLFWGVSHFTIGAGVAAACIGELFAGLPMGIFMIPFVVAGVVLLALQKRWEIPPLMNREYGIGTIPALLLCMAVLIVIFFVTVTVVQYTIYTHFFSWRVYLAVFLSWQTFVYNMVILAGYLALFAFLTKEPQREIF